ncbi:VHS-domain-containing protein [Dacryopinax primogenitus]|uniref:VHS-domain-containing protein n=1 Tax=Dacryopinax primogenitus (strain DJM 731) TaxID=1858805 RepID=M5FR92_DACPD|nr:VHS-domain-containing protein [Dacryopinax primogenitus]EJT99610.1 VHS-domain-containing protein [Dacryopinax primogenitus]
MLAQSFQQQASPVQLYVDRCCDPTLLEPNYALNLELAGYITQKKANTPREAAMAIVRYVNHRNPQVNMLALTLLQTLVQSVGYPFHLQVATKEFLNELVRRFPERPPPYPGPVMTRILEVINDWREGICKESRWKEDLGNIRDMHRLLGFKGYRFRDLPRGTNRSFVPTTENLKSPDELEEEDREAQAAKLQELIRRGTPRDLAAAQELMKIMAGANPDAKPDYRSQTLKELEKVQQKVILLNDLLNNASPGERFAKGDAYDQVATICRQARPKIQKWISDAESASSEDPHVLETCLELNDLINSVLNRYESYLRGDFSVQGVEIHGGVLGAGSPPPEPAAAKPIDLISLDESEQHSAVPQTSGSDDLAGLFGPAPAAPVQAAAHHPFTPAQITSLYSQGSTTRGMHTPQGSLSGFSGSDGFSPQPQNQASPAHPGFFNLHTMSVPQGSSRTGTPTLTGQQPQAQAQQQHSGLDAFGPFNSPPMQPMQPPTAPAVPAQNGGTGKGKDPFADLEGLF